MKRLHNSRGFTLIELIMVIVILGILAAVAIPRFMNLQSDAQKAAENGTAAGVRAGISVTHAAFLLKNTTAAPAEDIAENAGAGNGWPDLLDCKTACATATVLAGLFSFVIENGTGVSDNWSKTAVNVYKGPWGNANGNTHTWTYTTSGNGAGSFICSGATCP